MRAWELPRLKWAAMLTYCIGMVVGGLAMALDLTTLKGWLIHLPIVAVLCFCLVRIWQWALLGVDEYLRRRE